MSNPIVINGRSVALSHDLDSSSTNYIILRTKGEPLNKRQKEKLKDLDVVVDEFVGDETEQVYLCGFKEDSLEQINNLDFVDYVGIYANEFVVPENLQADAQAATVNVDILLQRDVAEVSEELIQKIAEAADVDPEAIDLEDGGLQIKVDADKLEKIAALDEVRVLHTINEPALFNNVARKILNLDDGNDSTRAQEIVYTGKDQIVCVADTGLDKGSDKDVHEAFSGRIKHLFSWGRAESHLADDLDGHGTHVCGSVLGKGEHNSQGLVQGTAPDADLIVQSLFSGFNVLNQARLGGIPKTNLAPLFDQAYQAGARVHTNSWGSPLPSTKIQRPYDGRAESIDLFVWEHQDMAILFAAGNDGQDADLDGTLDGSVNPRSLGAEASAKNSITVGATENYRPDLVSGDLNRPYTYGGFWVKRFSMNPLRDDHIANDPEVLAAFSSRGPTAEDRLKPDVVAPGTAILSARSQNQKFLAKVDQAGKSGDSKYMYLSGTSMATPLVAGCCAVLRQALRANGYRDERPDGVKNPTGSLIKALLINGAVPIKGQYMPDDAEEEHNPHSGFGRVDLAGSLPKLNDPCSGYGVGVADEDDEAPFKLEIPVPDLKEKQNTAGTTQTEEGQWTLKVTLAYADLPGGKLQNDLNLIVVVGEHEYHGNQTKRKFPVDSKEAFDRQNNVERVSVPTVSTGKVQIIVKPFRFMSERVPFAYAWRFS
ncbi:subtilisin, putative [Talaromyces stipitatus ATCC 10500]|uniref:Subtilisin, putative n=1 Tax=Talaromyces stipitatus (strain ATCC 10500 / CBS 375.48 / QM 6759 / NRRL 1006) TaxID=441959 RepID=B8M482_TALSN|nr:subtilisin, putative [Talaromyces stipitatus ATCC 10500]EED20825.1 subtilisin, putative [Talaromyces stipitatus ATCC 10500]